MGEGASTAKFPQLEPSSFPNGLPNMAHPLPIRRLHDAGAAVVSTIQHRSYVRRWKRRSRFEPVAAA